MGRHKSVEERQELGERVAHLRDELGLTWTVICERLPVGSIPQAVLYYKIHERVLLAERKLAGASNTRG